MQKWDEQARLFLEKAFEDEEAIKVLAATDRPLIGIIGFHAQQAIEKRFKALLSHHRLSFPATHDLEQLLDLLADSGLEIPAAITEAMALQPYAVHWRYPSFRGEPPAHEELAVILKHTEAVRDWTDRLMRQ